MGLNSEASPQAKMSRGSINMAVLYGMAWLVDVNKLASWREKMETPRADVYSSPSTRTDSLPRVCLVSSASNAVCISVAG